MKTKIRLEANGKDVTNIINQDASKVSFHDEDGTQADEIKLTIEGEFKRPQYKDELKLWIGTEKQMMYCGLFAVQNSTSKSGNTACIEISATAVDFNGDLKVKRSKSYENISIKQIASLIATRHSLDLKSDFDDIYIQHLEQTDESDLHFLKRMADEYNALFAIKNNSLIFKKKIKGDKKNEDLPRYYLEKKDNTNIDIQSTNKEQYGSCVASWWDTKENKQKSVTVGKGEPVKHIKDSFESMADAKAKAQASLQKANSKTKIGTISTSGFTLYAGGILVIKGTLEDDGEYHIKTADHSLSTDSGWTVSIEIEN